MFDLLISQLSLWNATFSLHAMHPLICPLMSATWALTKNIFGLFTLLAQGRGHTLQFVWLTRTINKLDGMHESFESITARSSTLEFGGWYEFRYRPSEEASRWAFPVAVLWRSAELGFSARQCA